MNVRVPAASWNAGLKVASGLKVLPGRGVRVRRSANGTSLSLESRDFDWTHPWKVSAQYIDGAWRFRVAPGFVNGEPPLVEGTAPKKENEEDEEPPNLSILETDWIEARGFLPLGTELNPVPRFFLPLGAKNVASPNVTTGNFDSINLSELTEQEAGIPLVKFEIFLSKARAQLVSTPQIVDGTGLTGTLIQTQFTYDTTLLERNGPQARLLQGQMPRPDPSRDAVLRALGLTPDEQEDRILVAIVYLLAKDASADPNVPDEKWTAFIDQKLHWNLSYQVKNDPPRADLPPTIFFTGLALGLGDALINQQQALQKNLIEQALDALDTTEPGGRYWSI
jgi:hypothetical protein